MAGNALVGCRLALFNRGAMLDQVEVTSFIYRGTEFKGHMWNGKLGWWPGRSNPYGSVAYCRYLLDSLTFQFVALLFIVDLVIFHAQNPR